MKTFFLSLTACAFLLAAGCSSSKGGGTPTRAGEAAPPPTPTPGLLSRINPYVIEETETYTIQRYPKKEYIRVDDRHIKHPLLPFPVEFFKEDEEYYYVHVPKLIPEEEALKRELGEKAAAGRQEAPPPPTPPAVKEPRVPLSDFTNLSPPTVSGRLKLEEVASSGLPESGLWRASFVMADMNGDAIPDIVAPPSRLSGDATLHIWVGNGEGKFSRWPLTFTEEGSPRPNFSIDYGGVAVGDIDRDGKLDVVCASHIYGLVSLFGDGKGGFAVVRAGLPKRDFSAQAIAVADVNGDGKLDIIASRDLVDQEPEQPVDNKQVRVYLYQSAKGWEFKRDGLVGGFYSNSLHAWDYDGDGRKDVLTGSHYVGALTLLWENEGNGTFSAVSFPEIENYAYHFATVPGTFGKERVPAFADAFYMYYTNEPEVARAAGISLYRWKEGAWARYRVWRKKNGTTMLYALAMGDLDRDGLDDIVFPDSEERRLRVFFQKRDGSFEELSEKEEPALDSPGQCVRLADVNGDGRLDILLAKTVSSVAPEDPGGWSVYINRK